MCTDVTVDTASLGLQINELNSAQRVVRTQRATTTRRLRDHFGDHNTSVTKTTKADLIMPANLESGKCKQLVENVRTRSNEEAGCFAFCMTELNLVLSDYDPKTQAFYAPVAPPKEPNKIDTHSRPFYIHDTTALYDDTWTKLSIAVRNRVSIPSNYGFGAKKLSGIASEGDGPTLVFALMCIFRSIVGAEEDTIKRLTDTHKTGISANDPTRDVKSMRSNLLEAKGRHIAYNRIQTDTKSIETACLDNHNMSDELADFKDITPLDSQVISTFTNLFEAFYRQCTKMIGQHHQKSGLKAIRCYRHCPLIRLNRQ